MPEIITLSNVQKQYTSGKQTVTALNEISLTINAGEIFSIIGYSGAGKSTLIRLINGLEQVSSGSIIVDGQDVTKLSQNQLAELRQNIGMIFQHFNLLQSRTIFRNIEFPLVVAGWSKAEREERVWDLLDFVGLTDKAYNYPAQLSGGQKQRVGIARALANKPKVLLSDEATSALDPETTQDVLNLLKRTNRELGVTIVVITHEMEVVKNISDRVAVIDSGNIVEVGTVFDVFAKPEAKITKRFLNSIPRGIPNVETVIALKQKYPGMLLSFKLDNSQKLGLLLAELQALGLKAQIVYGNLDLLQGKEYGNIVISIPESDSPDALKEKLPELLAEFEGTVL